MSFQAVPVLVINFTHIVFGRKKGPVLESTKFKKSVAFGVFGYIAVVSVFLFAGGASAQQHKPALLAFVAGTGLQFGAGPRLSADAAQSPGISISMEGQAQPELNLEWQAPEGSPEPVSGYIVMRAIAAAGPFTARESSPQPQTSYLDTSVEDGTTYYYEVESVGSDGVSSVPSSTYEVLAANTVAFGNQTAGSLSASQTVTVTNTGNAALTFNSIGLTGTNSDQFATSNNCGTSLAATDSCTINLQFHPTAARAATAALVLSDDASGSTQTIPLTGTGIGSGSPPALGAMQFNGSTNLAGTAGSLLRLTNGGTNQAGSAFYKAPVDIQSFSNDFTFQLAKPSADGMTFTIQNEGPAALGQIGGGLGYAGIGKSVAIKFDLYNNSGEGSDSTGVFTEGAQPTVPALDLSSTGINLHSGDWMYVQMTYDGSKLTVKITDDTTLAAWSFSSTLNIPSIVGGTTAYVGFTGGTGGLVASQKVGSWTYTSGSTLLISYPKGFVGAN